MPDTNPATTTKATITGAIPDQRTSDAMHRHDGHHHPPDLSEAENDAVDSAHEMYPQAAYALEHSHDFHVADPHHADDHG
ncbi:MAG TPA: hypothetical protein VK402_07415 [Blastococcus sp.]|nr:hypothetical protein [Blastococcus sp.]